MGTRDTSSKVSSTKTAEEFLAKQSEGERLQMLAALKVSKEEGDKVRELVKAMKEVARYLKWER